MKFMAHVDGWGDLSFDDYAAVTRHLHQFDRADVRLEVTIEKYKRRRSLKQNKRQWGGYRRGVKALSEHTGHTEKELHEYFKATYCPLTEVEVLGVKKLVRSTALLTTAQHNEYTERVAAEMAQHGIDIYPERRTA